MSNRKRYTILISAACAGLTTFLALAMPPMPFFQFVISVGVMASVMGALYSIVE